MKKYILITLSAVLLITLCTAFTYNAQTKDKVVKHSGSGHILSKDLNLTDTQKDQIDKLRYEHKKEVTDLRYEIKKNRIEIEELLKSSNLDENKIRSYVDKNSDLQAKIKKSALNLWFKTYNLLDDKQKETWRKESPLLNEGGMRHMIMHDGNGMGLREKIIQKFRHMPGPGMINHGQADDQVSHDEQDD
jgi:Spy/CpxP family protein refolding chaperone